MIPAIVRVGENGGVGATKLESPTKCVPESQRAREYDVVESAYVRRNGAVTTLRSVRS
jgi:hypothetical protein